MMFQAFFNRIRYHFLITAQVPTDREECYRLRLGQPSKRFLDNILSGCTPYAIQKDPSASP
jgi:hypothetical protein